MNTHKLQTWKTFPGWNYFLKKVLVFFKFFNLSIVSSKHKLYFWKTHKLKGEKSFKTVFQSKANYFLTHFCIHFYLQIHKIGSCSYSETIKSNCIFRFSEKKKCRSNNALTLGGLNRIARRDCAGKGKKLTSWHDLFLVISFIGKWKKIFCYLWLQVIIPASAMRLHLETCH